MNLLTFNFVAGFVKRSDKFSSDGMYLKSMVPDWISDLMK
jgi:hypothetical protein